MSPAVAVAVMAIVLVVTTVTRVTAFGSSLLSVPLLSLLLDPKTAVVSSIALNLVNAAVLAWLLRDADDAALARRVTAGVLLGLPVGAAVLDLVSAAALKALIAVVVLAGTAALARQRRPVADSAPADVGVGVLVGALTTSVSTNGPPLVVLLQARHLPPDPFRATLARVFLVANVVGLALSAGTGHVTADVLATVAAALPGLVVGQFAGLRLARRVSPQRFRSAVLALLVATALTAGVSAVV
jgi:uncharacterized membrane protein YfcA